MTWWNPMEIYQFARAAGFGNDTAKKAAAVAVVATQGADHYTWAVEGAPETAQAGLWGLPLASCPDRSQSDLLNPATAAQVARELWRAAGNTWDWHPVYVPDAGAMLKRTYDALDKDGLWVAKAPHIFAVVGDLRRHSYTSPRLEQVYKQLTGPT